VLSSVAVGRRLEVRNRALVVALGVLEDLAHGVSRLLIDSEVASLLAKRKKQGRWAMTDQLVLYIPRDTEQVVPVSPWFGPTRRSVPAHYPTDKGNLRGCLVSWRWNIPRAPSGDLQGALVNYCRSRKLGQPKNRMNLPQKAIKKQKCGGVQVRTSGPNLRGRLSAVAARCDAAKQIGHLRQGCYNRSLQPTHPSEGCGQRFLNSTCECFRAAGN
jgi:hypothetical protein